MAQVRRSPFNEIPEKIAFDPELGPFFMEILSQLNELRARTGGDEDQIENARFRELFPWQDGGEEKRSFQFGEPRKSTRNYLFSVQNRQTSRTAFRSATKKPQFFSVSANHTTAGDEFVEASSNITIFLNSNPDIMEAVTIKRNTAAGVVTIDGNGKSIDGAVTQSLSANYDFITMIYSHTSDEWLIVSS